MNLKDYTCMLNGSPGVVDCLSPKEVMSMGWRGLLMVMIWLHGTTASTSGITWGTSTGKDTEEKQDS